jgi:hypothetical protein
MQKQMSESFTLSLHVSHVGDRWLITSPDINLQVNEPTLVLAIKAAEHQIADQCKNLLSLYEHAASDHHSAVSTLKSMLKGKLA